MFFFKPIEHISLTIKNYSIKIKWLTWIDFLAFRELTF